MSDASRPLSALLPLKGWHAGKRRLAGAVSAERLPGLVAAMAEDVFATLREAACVGAVIAVTDDPDASALAARYGAETWPDGGGGLNAGVSAAVRRLAAAGAREVMVVHGDLPLLDAGELSALVACHRREGHALSIAPDRRCQGSNVLVLSPPDAIPLGYGPGSCRRHLAAAAASGQRAGTLFLPGCALDIDTPADLDLLRRRAGAGCRAARA